MVGAKGIPAGSAQGERCSSCRLAISPYIQYGLPYREDHPEHRRCGDGAAQARGGAAGAHDVRAGGVGATAALPDAQAAPRAPPLAELLERRRLGRRRRPRGPLRRHGRSLADVFVVDTNVLVYAADRDAPAHAALPGAAPRLGNAGGALVSELGDRLRVASHHDPPTFAPLLLLFKE